MPGVSIAMYKPPEELDHFNEIVCPSPYMIDISLTLSPKERYLEIFMLLYLLEVCQEGFLIGNMEDRVLLDVMDSVV